MRKILDFGRRHAYSVAAAVGVGIAAIVDAAPSFATTNTDGTDLTPVVTGFTADLTNNLPIILGVLGGLIALGVALRFFTRHSNAK